LATLILCTACDGDQIILGSKSLLDACPAVSVPVQPAGSIGAIVDRVIAQEVKTKGLPGMAVAIAKDGAVLYSQGYGYSDLKSCVRTHADTPYAIGSVTKQFTAAAMLQLQAAGSVDLDKPVAAYLPAYRFDPRITLRMLLNQTAGLADYLELPKPADWLKGVSKHYVLDVIVKTPLHFAPGSAYEYSNSNYFVLGAVIESVAAVPYADYLAIHVLQPANLTQTNYQRPLSSALPYSYEHPAVPGAKGLAVGLAPDSSVYFSAGALWSTVTDLARWNAALRKGGIVPTSQLAAMTTPPKGIPYAQDPALPSDYAMGLTSATLLGRPFVWHNGQPLAYSSFNGQFLDNGFSISIVTNVDVQEDIPLIDVASALIQGICTSSSTAGSC